MKKMKRLSSLFVLAFAVIFSFHAKVNAQTPGYEIIQTAQTQDSVTVNWEKALTYLSDGYVMTSQTVSIYEYNYPDNVLVATVPIPNVTDRSYTFGGLKPGTDYYVTYQYTYQRPSGTTGDDNASDHVYTLPGKVTNVRQDKWWYWALNCDTVWDEQNGVDGYEYVVKDEKGKNIDSGSQTYGNKHTFKVKNNMVYNIVVRAYTDINGQRFYGDWSDKAYCFTQPMVNKVSYGSKGMTIKWDKIKGCNKYTVYASTKEKKGYKKVKTIKASKNSLTISKIKGKKVSKNKTYYIYIVGEKKIGGRICNSGRHYTQTIKGTSVGTNWTF